MSIERVIDHVEQAKSLLLSQYKGGPRMEALLSALVRQVQLLDDATYDVFWKRIIDFAEAAQLDVIGKIVGESRLGDDDATYRIFIGARIRVNRSEGTTIDIAAVLGIIVPDARIDLSEVETMGIVVTFFDEVVNPVRIRRMTHDTRAGGVGLTFIVPASTPARQLRYFSVGDTPVGDAAEAAHCFGDTTESFPSGLAGDVVTER